MRLAQAARNQAKRPIECGLAGPGLLASTIVQRWQDHLPLNRQDGGRSKCLWRGELVLTTQAPSGPQVAPG